jgi:putative ABC transport system permease protein
MLHNYLAAALRNLVRNRLYAAINIVGLAVGFAAAILIALFARDEFSYDTWVPGYRDVYHVAETIHVPGQVALNADVTFPQVAAWLKLDFPSIQAVGRLNQARVDLRHGQIEAEQEGAYWADPDIVSIFPFKAVAGSLATALRQPDGVVMTRTIARKYFGRDDPIGETIEIDRQHAMKVTAVIDDLPSETHLNVTVLLSGLASFSNLAREDKIDFSADQVPPENNYTYFRLPEHAPVAAVAGAMPGFVARHLAGEVRGIKLSDAYGFDIVPLAAIHLRPMTMTAMKSPGDRNAILAVSAVGVLIVLVASINFVNLMTARAVRRSVEVGIRKVFGASRAALIAQFLGESLLYAIIGMAAAMALVELLLPVFNAFLDRTIRFDYWRDPALGIGILGLTASVGILAGFYPAFVLSAFRPAFAFRSGRTQTGRSGGVRQILVVLQFAILIGLIIATGIIFRQTRYATQDRLHLGQDPTLLVSTPCKAALLDQVRALPGVREAACASGSALDLGRTGTTVSLSDGDRVLVRTSSVDVGFLEYYGLRPLAGRLFARDRGEDAAGFAEDSPVNPPVILNETAARKLGFASPAAAVGRSLPWVRVLADNGKLSAARPSEIIGVVPDFSVASIRDPIEATFYYVDPGSFEFMNVKLRHDQIPQTLRALDRLWTETGNAGPIRRFFLDQHIQSLYVDVVRQEVVFAAFAGIALFIACLGLFGLSAFTAEQRTKEIGIRKAMGATPADIVKLLVWRFTKPVLWANVIAWPAGWLLMDRWLGGFAYHVDIEPWIFPASAAVALMIALGTVSVHAVQVASARPVAALRQE